MDHTTIYPPLSRRELDGAAVSKKAAKEGMVLLRNRAHALPLTPGAICLFGNGAVRTVRGGTGSGGPFNGGLSGGGDVHVDLSPRYHIQLLPAMQKAGFTVLTEEMLLRIGERFDEGLRRMENRVMSSFTLPEEAMSEAAARAYAAGTDTHLCAALGEGYTAQERDGLILVNGGKIYAEAATVFDAFRLKERYQPMKTPVDTRIAHVEDGGRTIVYRVKDAFRQTICRGDVQRCAANILKVMLRLNRHL